MKIDLPLTEPQEQFVFSDAKAPAIVGGLGSGKSQAGITRLVLLLLSDKGANGAYDMPTYDLLKLRAMPGVEELLLRMKIPFSVNKSDYTIAIKGYGNIIFRSYDKPTRRYSK